MTGGTAALRKPEPAPVPGSARGSSFYAAMRIMPPHKRDAMYEIYRYCRALDDIADEEGEPGQKLRELNTWRGNIALIFAGIPPLELQDLARTVADFALRREDLLAVIDGVEMDVRGPVRAPDFTTLTMYCDRVACAVGRLSVRVFGMEEHAGLDLAHHLGLALQFTNILRDIDEDAALGRLYLPGELLREAGITDTNPTHVLTHPALAKACLLLADKARAHFAEADAIMRRCGRRQVRTPQVMAQAYRAILSALIGRGFDSPRRAVHLSKVRLGYILMRNLLF